MHAPKQNVVRTCTHSRGCVQKATPFHGAFARRIQGLGKTGGDCEGSTFPRRRGNAAAHAAQKAVMLNRQMNHSHLAQHAHKNKCGNTWCQRGTGWHRMILTRGCLMVSVTGSTCSTCLRPKKLRAKQVQIASHYQGAVPTTRLCIRLQTCRTLRRASNPAKHGAGAATPFATTVPLRGEPGPRY